MLAEKIFRMGIMFFITVWMARYLGARQFGILNYVLSYVGIFTPFVLMGLESIVVKSLIDYPHRYYEILGTAFLIQWAGAFLAFTALYLSGYLFENDPMIRKFILILGLSYFLMPALIIDQWFQAKVLAKYSSMARMFQLLCCAMLRLGGIVFTAALPFFIWVLCLDYFFLVFGFIFFFWYTKKRMLLLKFDRSIARKMLMQSLPLIFSALIIAIYMRIDQVMIAHMMNDESVGLYAAAVRVSQAWYFIPMILVSSLFPALLNAKKVSRQMYLSRLGHIYRIVFYISFVIAVIMYLMSGVLIDTLYGESFHLSRTVFQIHIWAFVFAALGTVMNRFVISEGLQHYEMIYLFSAMILNILLNIILIPIMGIRGAALSTVISQCFGNMIFPLFLNSQLRHHIHFQIKALLFIK